LKYFVNYDMRKIIAIIGAIIAGGVGVVVATGTQAANAALSTN
jgi:hypothetical protein